MATITTSCPQCEKQIKVPEEIAGKKIKCKGCGHAFVVASTSVQPADKGLQAEAPTKKPSEDEDFGDGKPYGVTDLDLAPRCPHCANELEEEDQVICLICGFNNVTRQKADRKRTRDPDGMDYFLWLLPGVLSVLLFFVCLAELINDIIGWATLDMSNMETVEKSGNNCCGLWCAIFCVYMMFVSARFAIKRLILNWKPPEEELHTSKDL